MECGVYQVHAQNPDRLLLQLRRRIVQVDVQKQLTLGSSRLVLKADAQPPMLVVGARVIPGGHRVGKYKKACVFAARRREPLQHQAILKVEHRQQPLFRYIAGPCAVNIVADYLVISGNCLGDCSRCRAHTQEPPRHFLTRSNFRQRSVNRSVEIQRERLAVRVAHFLPGRADHIVPSRAYFRVFTYSAIAWACSAFSPEIALLCGALLVGSPFVICSVNSLTSSLVPLSARAFMTALPSPLAPWQGAHFDLNLAAPSSAAMAAAPASNNVPKLKMTLRFIPILL